MAKILIVDDEKSIRTTLAEFIREEGHEVFTAEDAAEALRLLDEQHPSVVVTDIILPRMTGVGLLKQIAERSPDIQVIMITGEPTAETAAEAVRLGAFDYLSKPIARVDFKSAVTSALRVTELAQERTRLEEENRRYQEHLEEEVSKKTGALRESEAKYRAVVENASEAVFVAQDGVLPYANPSTARLSGRSLDSLGTTPFIDWVHPNDRERVSERNALRLSGAEVSGTYEFRIVRPNGDVRWLELHPVLISWEGKPATLNFASDITDRKNQADLELARQRKIQERDASLIKLAMDSVLYHGPDKAALQTITEAASRTLDVERVGIWLFNNDASRLCCDDVYERSKDAHSSGASLKRDAYPTYFDAIQHERTIVASDAINDPITTDFANAYLRPLGIASMIDAPIWLEGKLVGVVCHEHVGQVRQWEREDITFASSIANLTALALEAIHRQRAERERERSESRYRNLFDNSPISLWQEDYSETKAYLQEIASRGIDDLESHLHEHPKDVEACIRRIRVVDINQATLALHGATSKEQLLANLSGVIPPETRREFIPQLLAIYNGDTSFEGTGTDQRLDGSIIHAAIRWIAAPGYEETLERVLVSKNDITATVEAERSLQQALDGTIRALGATTETRDPYTAGHQRQVTKLAVAIAREMGVDDSIIEGTRVAGLMHDIGKLAIPAEILSKPSALNSMERSLIESHPEAAYEILKAVSFPWPIADIVIQHHERVDGSGYPRGLSGEDIRIEARILAVADTVEAMASHRPYRPALGIDLALEEIEKNRGAHFEPAVVDACLRLFQNGGFTFEDDD